MEYMNQSSMSGWCFALVCVLFGAACGRSGSGDVYDNDLNRVRLTKGYDLISANRGWTWVIMLKDHINDLESDQLAGIESIAVHEEFVFVFVGRTHYQGTTQAVWFSLNASSREELAFSDHASFRKYAHDHGIQNVRFRPLSGFIPPQK